MSPVCNHRPGVERLRGLSPARCGSPPSGMASGISISPLSASFSSMFGAGGPTVPILTAPGRLTVPSAVVSDIPQSSPRSIPNRRMEEISITSDRQRRRARVHGHRPVEPERLPHRGEDLAGRPVPRGPRSPRAPALAALLQADLLDRGVQRLPERAPLIVGPALGLLPRPPRLHLLPDPGHGEEPVGPDLRQEGDDLARVRGAGGRARVHHRVCSGRSCVPAMWAAGSHEMNRDPGLNRSTSW